MSLEALVLLTVYIGMPLGFAAWIWFLNEQTRLGWILMVAYPAVIVLLIILVGRWDIAGSYTRLVVLLPFVAAVVLSGIRHARRPWRMSAGPPLWKSHGATIGLLAIFGAAAGYVIAGTVPPASVRSLGFPLQGGRFMVVHGGGNTLLNYHNGHRAQRFAVDITAIGPRGFRASGVFPHDAARYVAWGAAVVSPCDGEVTRTRNDLPDLRPPRSDRENAAGNHVAIVCDGMTVELAHLQNGSVEVRTGDRLTKGMRLGRLGNSGNTSEPHLHIHAVDSQGLGVPIVFEGRFPVRNGIFDR